MKTISRFRLVSIVLLTLFALKAMAQQPAIQYFRHYDKRGINVFEPTKEDSVVYDGFKLRFGAGFTQNFQSLKHSTKGESTPGTVIPLYAMRSGFQLAQANFNIDAQLADGVSLNLISYMASHHHNEFWVKGGYLKVEKVTFLNSEFMNKLWKNLTLKVGHMEVNYGDAHYRRSDGGNTFWNPWVDNNIMDEFTTEIGGELYWQNKSFIVMASMTDGEIQGNVADPAKPASKRAPSFIGKIGYDKQFNDNFRFRLTGSAYTTKSSISNTIFGGDRTGSNYQYVMEVATPAPTLTGNAFSGRFNPGFRDNVTAFMINPFVKYSGLEVFGTFEFSKGSNAFENGEGGQTWDNGQPLKVDDRKANQTAIEALYRFGKTENFYLGARYNKVSATIPFGQSASAQGTNSDITIDRTSIGAGWFVTKSILLKGEYVNQNYSGYPTSDRFFKANFKGFVVQGAIAF